MFLKPNLLMVDITGWLKGGVRVSHRDFSDGVVGITNSH